MLSQQEISDRLEIQDLLTAYCDAIDSQNWDALDDIFTSDAIIDYTDAGGAKGTLEEIKLYLDKALKPFSGCLLYTSPSPRDGLLSRMPSSA